MPPPNLAPSELRYLLVALSREWERELSGQVSGLELTSAQVEIVLVLNESGPCTMQELSELLILNRDPFRAVTPLESRGLVERGSKEDRRKVTWALTEEGISAAEKISSADLAVLQSKLGRLPTSTSTDLVNILHKFSSVVLQPSTLEDRFGAQRTSVTDLLAAEQLQDVQTSRSETIATRLQTIIGILDAGDHRRTFARFEPAFKDLQLGPKAWDSLVFRGGPVSISTLSTLSKIMTDDSTYLLSKDESSVRETESRVKAEVALSIAGVSDFGGRGTLDADALHALAELVQKRLGTTERG
ncbi:MarR family winged helix-turn-helix transcriptional regulator [Paenarthrobacter sp. NPDC056912]|uniref:MarR family winged helix-turn-helix transcriptional regulator n=1 Tax=Paenarthrobacter sp. NPDC056912 TaxID=3345965 RepID=UPI00366ACDC3